MRLGPLRVVSRRIGAKLSLSLLVACSGSECGPEKTLPPAPPASLAPLQGGAPPRASGCGKPLPTSAGALVATEAGRTFRVYPPRDYDANKAYPVLFALHGWNANGAVFQAWFRMEDHVAGEAIVVYPDAARLGAYTAWDLAGDSDAVFLDDMRSALAESYCIDLARLYATGFSYGGKAVTALACKRPLTLRAGASNEASFAGNAKACAPFPMLVTHRTNDRDELLEWGKVAAETWARIDGCQGAPVPSDAAHGCVDYVGCNAKVTFCEDKEQDPTWPSEWNHTVRPEFRDLAWRWLRDR